MVMQVSGYFGGGVGSVAGEHAVATEGTSTTVTEEPGDTGEGGREREGEREGGREGGRGRGGREGRGKERKQ